MNLIVLLLLLELLFVRMGVGMSGGKGEQSRCCLRALCLLSLVFGSGGGRVLGLGVGKGNLGAAETGLEIKTGGGSFWQCCHIGGFGGFAE